MKWVTEILVLPVRLYRLLISPLLPRACRFYPSCSAYAIEAVRRHGPVYGLALALGRLLRCHPLHPGGVDPVPTVGPKNEWTWIHRSDC